jgi:putative NADH-flavin reductase
MAAGRAQPVKVVRCLITLLPEAVVVRVIVFGSTGRVGRAAVARALAAGHEVRAAVRSVPNVSPFDERVRRVVADVREPDSVAAAVADTDAAIVAVGGDVFKPSDVVTRSARAIVDALTARGIRRYVGITGVAQMKPRLGGAIAQAVLRRSPIRYAVADHQRAFEIVAASGLDWTLAGCPWIKDGAHPGRFREHLDTFPGGFHTVSPVDVGAFLAAQVSDGGYLRRVVGLW